MKMLTGLLIAACMGALFFCASCNTDSGKQTLFELMDNTGIEFDNKVQDGKLENSFQFRNFYNGGGVATGDLNNDGLPDVVLTSNLGNNTIYINKGQFRFTDITAGSGLVQNNQWSTGVTLVDINHDGWLDIYICNSGHVLNGNRKNQLYINNHDLSFTESAAKYGLDHSGYCTQAAFFDYDLDGDLDCFIIDNSPIPFNTLNYANMRDSSESAWKVAENLKGGGNHLLRNDHDHFVEVTSEAGIHGSLISFGLGLSVSDINGDGYPDIYVGNDFLERDYLYINQKNGTFKDELTDWVQHISMSSMGSDIADINNDGYPDIYTTDMLAEDDYRFKTTGVFDNVNLYRSKQRAGYYQQFVRNCLQLNNQDGKFKDIANISGTAATDWSWGLLLFDADNDGFNDIYVCNGINRDLGNLDFLDFFSNDISQNMLMSGRKEDVVNEIIKKIPSTPILNKVYRNLGNLKFEDAGKSWGFTQPSFSNSVAYADLDNDGDLDIVVNNENQPAFVYQNHSREKNKNNYVAISVKGKGDNTFAIGTKIKLYRGSQVMYREIEPTRGFQSSVEYRQVIGIGTATNIDSMVVTWPDRSHTRFEHPAINQILTIVQPDLNPLAATGDREKVAKPSLFIPVKTSFEKHTEDDYVDFFHEANIPELLSREGPHATVGDVDGDGLADVFIAGAAGSGGQLYLQKPDGSFREKPEKDFQQFAQFEDVAVLFFDCDRDGDPDLFIGSGGNKASPGSRELQHRLYINDGKGNFTLDTEAFPSNTANTSVAAAYDIDGDGDLDLFVGSRSMPMQYGVDPPSHIYLNDGHGHFSELPKDDMGPLNRLGMVTGAVWADLSGDHQKKLVVVGDWMTPRVFSFKKNHVEEIKTNLDHLYGWWRTIQAADLNGDGKEDLVLGNIGENFYLNPNEKNPVRLWVNDFDQNNVLDKIMTHSVNGKDMPVFLKHEMEAQLPFLKKQNLLHKDFAKKSIQELIAPQLLDAALVKQFNFAASIIAMNNGEGNFSIVPLPEEVQFSSVNAVLCEDINQDGLPDLLLGGNDFNFVPQFGRLDASFGQVLINRGKGLFTLMDDRSSGLGERGQIRDIKSISVKGKSHILILQNDAYPVLYQVNDLVNAGHRL